MPSKKQTSDKKPSYEDLGKMLVSIFESGYIDKNKSYKSSFIKGVLGGFGGVIGATIVVGLLIWILSFFKQIPFIGPSLDKVRNTVQEQKH